ncbi:prostate stem cell antigen [Mantella aurantiaca]
MAISDASCQTLTNCTGSTPYCGAAIVDGVFVTLVNKFCAATCVNADQNFTFVSASEMCCTSDRCNDQTIGNVNSAFNFGSGASGLSGSALLMAALLGALLSYMFAL